MSFSTTSATYAPRPTQTRPQFDPFQPPTNWMPQARPQEPGLMDIIGRSLGAGLGEGIGGGIKQQIRQSMLDKVLSGLKPNMSPQDKARVLLQLQDPQDREVISGLFDQEAAQNTAQASQQGLQSIYGGLPQQQYAPNPYQPSNAQEGAVPIEDDPIEREKQGILNSLSPIPEQRKEQVKRIQELQDQQNKEVKRQKEIAKEKKEVEKTFNEIVDIFKSGNTGIMGSTIPLTDARRRAKAKLGSLLPKIIDKVRKMEQNGHLSDIQFNAIKATVPNANDMDATFMGKLEGLADILGIQPPDFSQEQKNETQNIGARALGNKIPQRNMNISSGTKASEVPKNSIVIDKKTGKKYISNGSSWQEYNQ